METITINSHNRPLRHRSSFHGQMTRPSVAQAYEHRPLPPLPPLPAPVELEAAPVELPAELPTTYSDMSPVSPRTKTPMLPAVPTLATLPESKFKKPTPRRIPAPVQSPAQAPEVVPEGPAELMGETPAPTPTKPLATVMESQEDFTLTVSRTPTSSSSKKVQQLTGHDVDFTRDTVDVPRSFSEPKSRAPPRRSSKKIQQLMGHDVGPQDDMQAERRQTRAATPVYAESLSGTAQRASSKKVQQLTGHKVDIVDDSQPHSGTYLDSDSSSSASWSEDVPDYYVVPVLESDTQSSPSSRGSSWGPSSPEQDSPFDDPKPRDDSPASSDRLSYTRLVEEDGLPIYKWDPDYSQFGDSREYHRFTAQLACYSAQNAAATDQSATPTKKKRSSFGGYAMSAASRLTPRRREHSEPTVSTVIENPSMEVSSRDCSPSRVPRTLPTGSPPPRPSPAPVLTSAWDPDSDDEGDGHRASLRTWFSQRSGSLSGESKPIRAKDRQKQILAAKAAKRREALMRQTEVAPEGARF